VAEAGPVVRGAGADPVVRVAGADPVVRGAGAAPVVRGAAPEVAAVPAEAVNYSAWICVRIAR
jgi:hypothetical protein